MAMRRIRAILIVLLVALFIVSAIAAVAYVVLNARNAARPEATNALSSDESVTVSQVEGEDWYVFSPAGSPATGLIIYPGGFVDPVAYAPIARALAQAGYLVVIDPMPLNLAVLDSDAADRVVASFPDIKVWAIGGHSLGGAMAAEYVAGNDGRVDGLVLWAAYPANRTDLSDRGIEVVSIYGDADGLASVADITGSAPRLPDDTTFVRIPGGNHTQFGYYGKGLQRGDNPAGISLEEQQEMIIAATLQLLSAINQAP